MQLDDLAAHVQTNAGAPCPRVSAALMVFEPEEFVEDSRPERDGDSWTRIDDADGHHRRSARVRRGAAMTFDGHAPAVGRVFERIREDIGEDRAQTKRVSRDRRKVCLEMSRERDTLRLRLPLNPAKCVCHHRRDVNRLEIQAKLTGFDPRQIQELMNRFRQLFNPDERRGDELSLSFGKHVGRLL